MGVAGKPFREHMLKRGVAASELDGPGYAAARWADPDGLATADAARARRWLQRGALRRLTLYPPISHALASEATCRPRTASAARRRRSRWLKLPADRGAAHAAAW
eukprot:7385953-Prymnesium_polylepis.1